MNKHLLIYLFSLLMIFSISGQIIAQEAKHGETKTEVVERGEFDTKEHELPNVLMVIPFVILLLMIATGPIFYHHFWEEHYPKISLPRLEKSTGGSHNLCSITVPGCIPFVARPSPVAIPL